MFTCWTLPYTVGYGRLLIILAITVHKPCLIPIGTDVDRQTVPVVYRWWTGAIPTTMDQSVQFGVKSLLIATWTDRYTTAVARRTPWNTPYLLAIPARTVSDLPGSPLD